MRGGAHAKHGASEEDLKHDVSIHIAHVEEHRQGDIADAKQAVIWIKKAANTSDNWVDQCTTEQYEWYVLFKKMAFFCLLGKGRTCRPHLLRGPKHLQGHSV
jgi:hypothetical protein